MKLYGIAKEYWNGNSYSCNYDEDITIYFSKLKRDEDFYILKDNGDVLHYKFEVETED